MSSNTTLAFKFQRNKCFFPANSWRFNSVGSLRGRELVCSVSDHQGSNFESCVLKAVSSYSSHHPQKVLLAQISLYVHTGGLKPNLFISFRPSVIIDHWSRHYNFHLILWEARLTFTISTFMKTEDLCFHQQRGLIRDQAQSRFCPIDSDIMMSNHIYGWTIIIKRTTEAYKSI